MTWKRWQQHYFKSPIWNNPSLALVCNMNCQYLWQSCRLCVHVQSGRTVFTSITVFTSMACTCVTVENESHCDFVKLREMLIRVNMEDLREQTHARHYELYRRCKLEEMGFKDTDPDSQPFRWVTALHYLHVKPISLALLSFLKESSEILFLNPASCLQLWTESQWAHARNIKSVWLWVSQVCTCLLCNYV